jgi:hypothetical protein
MARRLLTLCFAVLALAPAAALAAGFPSSFAPLAHNPADALVPQPIEDYRYDRARHCTKSPRAGALALERWLAVHSRGHSWGIMRCEKLSRRNYSLHSEGRAIDWHLDARNPADRRAGRRLIKLLLAPDRAGNAHALARRMGVQEIIWDCRAWWSGVQEPVRYSPCFSRRGKPRRRVDATTAHRDHIHIGLNRMGAARLTSFWRAR